MQFQQFNSLAFCERVMKDPRDGPTILQHFRHKMWLIPPRKNQRTSRNTLVPSEHWYTGLWPFAASASCNDQGLLSSCRVGKALASRCHCA